MSILLWGTYIVESLTTQETSVFQLPWNKPLSGELTVSQGSDVLGVVWADLGLEPVILSF